MEDEYIYLYTYYDLCKTGDLTKIEPFYNEHKSVLGDNAKNCLSSSGKKSYNCWLMNELIENKTNEYYMFAMYCLHGFLDLAKWSYETHQLTTFKQDYGRLLFLLICEEGHFDIAKWIYQKLKENNINIPLIHIHRASFLATRSGNLEFLQWQNDLAMFQGINTKYTVRVMLNASCIKGHLHIIQWLYDLRLIQYLDVARVGKALFLMARLHGHLHIIQWIHVNVWSIEKKYCENLCGWFKRYPEIAKYLSQLHMDYLYQNKPDMQIAKMFKFQLY